jgi:hypothetical protein
MAMLNNQMALVFNIPWHFQDQHSKYSMDQKGDVIFVAIMFRAIYHIIPRKSQYHYQWIGFYWTSTGFTSIFPLDMGLS